MWREFFYFSSSDRRVLLVLLGVAVIVLAILLAVGGRMSETRLSVEDSLAMARQMAGASTSYHKYGRRYRSSYHYQQGSAETVLFPFDPNTADSAALLRLGLRPWQVRNIYKYRAAGGVYRRPQDFARLYGLTRKQYRELEPYIKISEDYLDAATLYNYNPVRERDTIQSPVKIQPLERVSLNAADTSMLKKVPGIGSHFARKIVEYRNRLGGYYDINQLREIEDFPETALSFFVIPDDQIRKMNVNKLSLSELQRHPYINFHQARAIVDYRRLKGPLHSLSDLRLSRDFPPAVIARLQPYVEF